MTFKASDFLPPTLYGQVLAGNVKATADSYDKLLPELGDELLMAIAARAASRNNVAVLEWTFIRGLELPRRSVNHILYQCATNSSPDVWRMLFAHGYDFNAHQSEVGDALSGALLVGNMALAKCLLEEGGADPNSVSGDDMNECGICALRTDRPELRPDMLRLLLRHGWTPTTQRSPRGGDGGGGSTAIAAAELGLLDELRILVEEGGADLEVAAQWFTGERHCFVENRWAWGTALYRAAFRGQEATVAYLLGRGARPTYRDQVGRSCLWAARHGGNDKVVQMFVERGVSSKRDDHIELVLHQMNCCMGL